MSCRLDNTADRLERTATVPAFGSFSVMFWAYRVNDGGDNEMIFALSNTGSGNSIGNYVTGAASDIVNLIATGPALQTGSTGSSFTTGTWRRIAVTFDDAANTLNLYTGDADPTTAMGLDDSISDAGSFVVQRVGFPVHQLIGGTFFDGRIANIKFYTAVLSAARLKTELGQFNIADATNIWGAWTCKTETTTITDQSGNSRDLTGTGLTSEADPPISDSTNPVITVQPAQQRVRKGQTANFSITATGTGVLHYQWKKNGTNDGTDSSSYSIGPTINSDNLTTVSCVVTDDGGSTTSTLVYLLVDPAAETAWIRA